MMIINANISSPYSKGCLIIVSEHLLCILQGRSCMADYTLEFRTYAAESRWNEEELKAVFHQGLNGYISSEMACHDDEASLDSVIDPTIHLDNLLRDCRP